MASSEEIKLGEIPETVLEDAQKDVVNYSIGFLKVKSPPRCSQDVTLLGSGTLVSVGATYAILTAHHVISVLPKNGRLGLILSPIARGTTDDHGPDLGAVILSPSIATAIGSKKSFYKLDTHRDQLISSPPDMRDGFWFINGFVDELTIEEPNKDGWALTKGFYNLCGAGGPQQVSVVGDYDYFDFPVSYGGRSVAPKSFGGMSGGGLWQVLLIRTSEGQLKHKKPILSGVVFYQEPTTDIYCGVKCHGHQSVYKMAFEAIKQENP